MTFPDASFDMAIDKATLDAMLYGSLWDPSDEVKENVKAYVDEVCSRVQKRCCSLGNQADSLSRLSGC